VYVYEAPVRLWHWVMAVAMLVLMATGYLIGSPLPSVEGEASEHFLLGYIRFAHFSAARVRGLPLMRSIGSGGQPVRTGHLPGAAGC
jgi:Ni/Fe-hydrogenase 1 B-type cytochrome subunit